MEMQVEKKVKEKALTKIGSLMKSKRKRNIPRVRTGRPSQIS